MAGGSRDRALPVRSLLAAGALAAGLLLVTLVVVLPTASDLLVLRVVDVGEVVFAVAAALSCALVARAASGSARAAWAFLAAAAASWAAGQAWWAAAELLLSSEAPFPSPADAGFLGMPVAGAVGLWLLAERRESGRRQLFDGVLVTAAVALLSWQTALGAVFSTAGGESVLAVAVSLAYPAGDVVLLTMTVLALAQSRAQRLPLALLAAGLTAFTVADGAFAYLNAVSTYATGTAVDIGWCAGFGLMSVAGLAARARVDSAAGRPAAEVASASLLPYVPAVLAAVVVTVRYVQGHDLDGPTLVLAVVVVAALMVRQHVALRDNADLVSTVAQRESQLRHQAFHDALTGLANRGLFTDRLAHALELRRRDPEALAVLFLDLDGFKGVNDTLGHAAGDELLVRSAERLRGALRSGDTLARLGGDEFAVLLERCDTPAMVAQHLVEAFRGPFIITGRAVALSVSVGIAVVPAGEAPPDADVLLRQADTAMYAVKRSGKNDFRVHTPGLRLDESDDAALHQALAAALQADAVEAHFQPVVHVTTGQVQGFETLARWQHAGQQVAPSVFIPVAERGGLAAALSDRMLERGLRALAAWDRQRGDTALHVAVNVSRHELSSAELPQRVAAALARHGLAGERLVVEVTESGLSEDVASARGTLSALRAQGVRIALDDFGTGYNSLAQLLHMPLDIVKIDRLFVHGVDGNAAGQRLLEGLLTVADRLALHVVAEGVETAGELRHLARIGVTSAQGYLLGRPSPDGGAATAAPAPLPVQSHRGASVSR